MAGEMKHLHLFPTVVPLDQITIVLNGFRRIDDGHSFRDRGEAAWWCAGYAASFVPDNHPVHAAEEMSDALFADHLDQIVAGEMKGLIPWDRLAKKFLELFIAWLNGL